MTGERVRVYDPSLGRWSSGWLVVDVELGVVRVSRRDMEGLPCIRAEVSVLRAQVRAEFETAKTMGEVRRGKSG